MEVASVSNHLRISDPERGRGYLRKALKGDVLYGFYRHKQLQISFVKASGGTTRVTDLLTRQMVTDGIISEHQHMQCQQRMEAEFATVAQVAAHDEASIEELYDLCHKIRLDTLGSGAFEQAATAAANRSCDFDLTGCIDQHRKKAQLLHSCKAIVFALNQPEFLSFMEDDLEAAQQLKKDIYVLCGSNWLQNHLDCRNVTFLSVEEDGIAYDKKLQGCIDCAEACIFAYGEDGLLKCRSLNVDSIVHAVPTGYYCQAVTNQLGQKKPCLVYIPAHFDITPWVGLRERTRLSFWHLAQLWKAHGDKIYAMDVPQLYRLYPSFFINIYENDPASAPSPIVVDLPEGGDVFSQFDSCRETAIGNYLSGFEDTSYTAAYFDKSLQPQPICYDSTQKQPGILVHAVRIKRAKASRVISCEKGKTLRQMFTSDQTGIVSNFLFFMTQKLATLYNDLRQDRPMEQANVATGHLDYMLCYRENERIETFPLFRKTCIAMKENGEFIFFNFRLGGGQVF